MNWWVGFDFDGTLVEFPKVGGNGKTYGDDIASTIAFLRKLKSSGIEVRIFSARAAHEKSRAIVQSWLDEHDLGDIAITDKKDFQMAAVLDDLALTVDPRTGQLRTHIDSANAILSRVGVRLGDEPK